MKVGIKHYEKPTPKKLRRLGDALLSVSTAITGAGIASDNKTLAIIALITGVAGKFLTNLFAE